MFLQSGAFNGGTELGDQFAGSVIFPFTFVFSEPLFSCFSFAFCKGKGKAHGGFHFHPPGFGSQPGAEAVLLQAQSPVKFIAEETFHHLLNLFGSSFTFGRCHQPVAFGGAVEPERAVRVLFTDTVPDDFSEPFFPARFGEFPQKLKKPAFEMFTSIFLAHSSLFS